MGTEAKWYLYGLSVGGTVITPLTDATPAANTEFITEYTPGGLLPCFRGAQGVRPTVEASSPRIKAVLDLLGFLGKDCSATNVDLYYMKAGGHASRSPIADTVHKAVRARRSLVCWSRLSVRHGGNAAVDFRVVPTYDGSNAPLVGLGQIALPAAPLPTDLYTLGPVSLNGTVLSGIDGWTLDLGTQIDETASDGEEFTSFVGIRSADPVLTVTHPDPKYWETLGLDGQAVTACSFALRKKAVDSTRNVAAATAAHVKFSNTDNPGGLATVQRTSGGTGNASSTELRIAFRVNAAGSAYPLAVNTAVAL
jgi:hypothetical protein